ncbi:MAG: DEAD/DEAH box helicase [Breznakia sp.]
MSTFNQFNLKQKTMEFIAMNCFHNATKIQEQLIPIALKHKDIIGISQTGTGKTHAFLIPILDMIDSSKNQVQAIISAPTRELALQIYKKALLMQKVDKDIKIKLITGGIEKTKMSKQLKQQPHIVIGTPGRMKDLFLNEQTLLLQTAKILVIDEADMTLEYGFLEDIDAICSTMKKLQILSFSATIPEALKLFLKRYMHQPQITNIKEDVVFKPRINHVLIGCKHHSYKDMLLTVLTSIDPYLCLIFTNTRSDAVQVAFQMRDNGYDLVELHGDLNNRDRIKAIKDIESMRFRYIVASDIAARGMDIEGVSHVISLGFPKELDFYIHRAGRTGRAGKSGTCFALYKENDETAIRLLQSKGIHFHHEKIVQNTRKTIQPIFYKRKRKDDPLEIEISKLVKAKTKKIKPGYKKKQKEQVEKLKRKAKRAMVQKEIKQQAKAKAKARQQAKRGDV